MTYEENVSKLLEIAGDYNSVVTNHALENSLYTATRKEITEELEKCIGSLSIGDCSVSLTKSGIIALSSNQWDTTCMGYSVAITEVAGSSDPLATFKELIRSLAFDIIRQLTSRRDIALSDVSRFASYANMAIASVDEDLVEKTKEAVKKDSDASRAINQENTNYIKYVKDVSKALSMVAYSWFEETTLVPGMKIAIVNLKSDTVSVRTIKKFTRTEDTIRITTKESSAIISNTDRIDIASTWFLNSKEHTDIARAIKWKCVEQFI